MKIGIMTSACEQEGTNGHGQEHTHAEPIPLLPAPFLTCIWRLDGVNVLCAGAACDLQDSVELIHGGGAWKDRLAIDELSQDAACMCE
jgi:hypothetical protein